MEEMFDVLNEWGEYTGEVASRDRCHTEGLWHRAVYGSTSIDTAKGINKHYNECYLILKDVDISDIKLQKEEVSEVRYFSKEEILERIDNNLDGLTTKTGPWTFLKKLLEK